MWLRKLMTAAAFFGVCYAWGDLPEGYEQVGGIASTKASKQYIYTDYTPSSSDIKIEAVVTLTKFETQCIWCSRGTGTTTDTMTLFVWNTPNYLRMDRNKNTGTYVGVSPGLDKPVTLVADYKNLTFTVGDTVSANKMANGDFTPASPISFFASHTAGSGWGNYAEITIHSVRIYDAAGQLEREYLPARCVANIGTATEFGLYETQKGKYFSTPGSVPFTRVDPASIEWSEDETTDSLIVTVAGNCTLNDDDVARIVGTTHENLVKRGPGRLIGAPIKAFTGNITIEEGIYTLAHRYDCGADNVGWIRVMDGATLELQGPIAESDGTSGRALTGKTIYTTGNGVGGIGAISGGCNWNSCNKCNFILEGDSLYRATSELNFLNYIDLAGHTLTGSNTQTTQRWGLSGTTITNSVGAASPAVFDFTGGMIRLESSSTFAGKREDGLVKFHSDSNYGCIGVLTYGFTSVWPVEIGPNARMSARRSADHTVNDVGVINGPITLKENVRLAWDIDAKTNSLINLKGTLTGSGTMDIGTGWVNFHTTANDYAGDVTVCRSNGLASAALRAGIGIESKAVYSAASTTLENADVDFFGGQSEVKGPLHFTGDGQSRMYGGSYTGERTKLGLVRKTGSGELFMSAGVTVTGRLEVAEGKVRFPTREENMPVVGRAGLMGSAKAEAIWGFNSPDDGTYDTLYPHGNDLTSRWNGSSTNPRTTMVKGYIWNRSNETKQWSFWVRHNWKIWFWLDGQGVFLNQNNTDDDTSIATLAITPGPHEYVLITAASNGGPSYVKWVNGFGSLYDSLPIDFDGHGIRDGKYFSPSIDPGDGSLFTIDDKLIDETTDPFWLPEIETAAFGPGAEFDVGNYDYRLPALEGFPKVTHVKTLTVEKAWTLDGAGLGAGCAMTVDGTLKFEEDAVLDLTAAPDDMPWAARKNLAAGVTLVTATAIEGLPKLSDRLIEAGATLTKSSDGTTLLLAVQTKRYVKLVDGAVEVGYAADAGLPKKEVRIDVYRDGILIDQRFVGDGYREMGGKWTYDGDGYYFAVATTSTADEARQAVFADLMVAGTDARVVSTAPGEGEYASIVDAVASLEGAAGRVYVKPGTYAEDVITNGVELTTAVQVIGLTTDPGEVVVTRGAAHQSRIFTLANANAAIRFLTVTGGELPSTTDYKEGNGGNVLVRAAGGTVENCILKDGSLWNVWCGGGGNIALWGGRMSNCRLVGARASSDDLNQWRQLGGSLMASGNVLIENCLITDCKPVEKRTGCAPIALYGKARMVNCTVANNECKFCGGVMLFRNDQDLPQIVNCAFFGNTTRNEGAEAYHVVYRSILCYRTNDGDNGCTDEEAKAAFVNCASPVDLNKTCIRTDEPLFSDAANGDYTLQPESPLVNAGAATEPYGTVLTTDLAGNPRVYKKIDVGCFEWRLPRLESNGLSIIVR